MTQHFVGGWELLLMVGVGLGGALLLVTLFIWAMCALDARYRSKCFEGKDHQWQVWTDCAQGVSFVYQERECLNCHLKQRRRASV